MAWRCSGSSNAELISNMVASGLIKSPRVAEASILVPVTDVESMRLWMMKRRSFVADVFVLLMSLSHVLCIQAMKKVDRAAYVPTKEAAYEDSPQPIGFGATISAPHMHAHAAENLLPFLQPGSRVLDVGSGSGYTAAIFYHLVQPGGKVVGIDHIEGLVEQSKRNLEKDGLGEALKKGVIEMVTGDGRQGYPPAAPYSAIHVGAAAPSVPPKLVEQLASPGRMFIPVGDISQTMVQVDKDESGKVTQKKLFGVMYVPLTDRSAQWP